MKNLSSKIVNATKRILTNDLEYFFEQFMYGNREILLSYIHKENPDFPANSFLKAGVAHGWAPDEQLWKLWDRNLARAPRFVWNDRNELNHIKNAGAVAIGSTWLYLLRMLGVSPGNKVGNKNASNSRTNLLMLTHNLLTTNKRIDSQAKYYREICDPNKTTVCLFWLDFCNPTIYKAYIESGFEVVCAGYPSEFDLNYQNYVGRPEFLTNLVRIMSRHDKLITDECTTSTFYAASLGLDVEIFIDPIASEFQLSWKKMYQGDGSIYFNSGNDWLSHYFPSLIDHTYNKIDLNLFAWDELGQKSLLSSTELQALPWTESKKILPVPLASLKVAILELKRELEFERIG
jgi:hypothetical protein